MMENPISAYLENVPPRFKEQFFRIRETILENLPDGYDEAISYKMLGYVVPLATYPPGYLQKGELPLPLMNLGYQKHHIALYHYGIYADDAMITWFTTAYEKFDYQHPHDIGKSCIRFKYMDEIPYNLIAELSSKIPVDEWIRIYEQSTSRRGKK